MKVEDFLLEEAVALVEEHAGELELEASSTVGCSFCGLGCSGIVG